MPNNENKGNERLRNIDVCRQESSRHTLIWMVVSLATHRVKKRREKTRN